MLTVPGTYKNGIITLDEQINITKNVKVIITFIDSDFESKIVNTTKEEQLDISDFSFLQSIDETQNINLSLAKGLIEERREEL